MVVIVVLKPCPFCAGKAVAIVRNPYVALVTCSRCGAKVEKSRKSIAIKAWNRRTQTLDKP